MDGQRFDDLARMIGSGVSRRGVLKMLGSSVGGGLGALLTRRGQAKAQCVNPTLCSVDADCCAGFTCDPESSTCVEEAMCLALGEACAADTACCSESCIEGACVTCRRPGATCTEETGCCGASGCVNGVCTECGPLERPCPDYAHCCIGECVHGDSCVGCVRDRSHCLEDAHCCNGSCNDGICATCRMLEEPCDDRNPCCSGSCFEGVCLSCLVAGSPCTHGSECCTRMCDAGVCSPCLEIGVGCSGSLQCCSNSCFEGVCSNCRPHPEPCGTRADCCSGICEQAGHGNVCASPSNCFPPGQPCMGDEECCSFLCQGGVCSPAACRGEVDCTVDEHCVAGICRAICVTDDECGVDKRCIIDACIPLGSLGPGEGPCEFDNDCDPELFCNVDRSGFGTCREPCIPVFGSCPQAGLECCDDRSCTNGLCGDSACVPEDGACVGDPECCEGLRCADGVCQEGNSGETPDNATDGVTALPDTGVGVRDGHPDPLLGITLAVGAVSLLAGKKLRETNAAGQSPDPADSNTS